MAQDDLNQRFYGGGKVGLHVNLMLDSDDPPKIEARNVLSKDGKARWLEVTFCIGPEMQAITLAGRYNSLVAALRDALAKVQAADEAGPGSRPLEPPLA